MPKATKAKTNTAKSISNPLGARKTDTAKQSLSSKEASSTSDERVAVQSTSPSNHTPNDERNYLLHVSNVLTSDPMIHRILSVPPSLTFGKFHEALQIAFGWTNSHMHVFTLEMLFPSAANARGEKLALPKTVLALNADPEQTMDDDEDMRIDTGYRTEDEKKWTLQDVFEKQEWGGQPVVSKADLHLMYEYDMGDGWEHQIQLLGRAEKGLHAALTGLPEEKAQKVLCVSGEGHPCAEDCGSAPGWEELKKAFAKPKGDATLKGWYKTQCGNGEKKGLDPWKWDLMDVNARLEKM